MTVCRLLGAIVCIFFVASAHAEPKRDIRGFYLGMSKAEFLENAQRLGLRSCRWQANNNRIFPNERKPQPPETASWIKIFACPDKSQFTVEFTDNLTPNLMTHFVYEFNSQKTWEAVDADVSQQFGVKSKVPGMSSTYDLGGGVELRFGGAHGQYELSLWTSKYNADDKKAGDEKQNRNAPALKF